MYAETNSQSPVDVTRIEAEAHALRSLTLANMLTAAGRRTTAVLGGLFTAFAEGRRMAAAYRELSALSDRELRDIGISRADIPSVVAGTFVREDETVYGSVSAMPIKPAPRTVADEDLRIAA